MSLFSELRRRNVFKIALLYSLFSLLLNWLVGGPATALGEFRRVLRRGGRIVILEFSHPTNRVLRFINSIYCGHIMPFSATILSGDRSGAYRYLPKSVATFADRQALVAMLADAGFADITQHPMTFGVCTASLGFVAC